MPNVFPYSDILIKQTRSCQDGRVDRCAISQSDLAALWSAVVLGGGGGVLTRSLPSIGPRCGIEEKLMKKISKAADVIALLPITDLTPSWKIIAF